ncbi:hypothetical protein ABZU92_18330 [Micromonospora arida]|uniref:hypothetical protein n=1 Tax=Micromonospora arida TaxID=2203715 RepID=UPI0033AEA363
MATIALTDATVWVGGYDFTGDINQLNLNATADQLDVTTFGSGGFRNRIGGLRDVSAQLAGFWSSGTSAAPDPHLSPDLGVADRVLTAAPDDAEGSVAYLARVGKFSTQMFGAVGDAVPFSLDVQGTNKEGLIRGRVLKAKGNVSATGATGTAAQLGAVGTGQFVYCTLHVFSAGTTITAVLESDDNAGFTTATTRATLGPITTTGGTWAARVAGAIADDYYRLRVTAVTGTFQIAAAAGIGS